MRDRDVAASRDRSSLLDDTNMERVCEAAEEHAFVRLAVSDAAASRLTFGQAVDRLRDELLAVQNAPHEEHAGPLCPICGLTTSLLAKLEEWRDD